MRSSANIVAVVILVAKVDDGSGAGSERRLASRRRLCLPCKASERKLTLVWQIKRGRHFPTQPLDCERQRGERLIAWQQPRCIWEHRRTVQTLQHTHAQTHTCSHMSSRPPRPSCYSTFLKVSSASGAASPPAGEYSISHYLMKALGLVIH